MLADYCQKKMITSILLMIIRKVIALEKRKERTKMKKQQNNIRTHIRAAEVNIIFGCLLAVLNYLILITQHFTAQL